MKRILLAVGILGVFNQAHAAGAEPTGFSQFAKQYNLKNITTEQHNQITQNLSHIFQQDRVKALELLHKVDQSVVDGFKHFKKNDLTELSHVIYKSINKGGRVFLVGSGSSGRTAIDLSAKWRNFWKEDTKADQVIGLIAGGPRAIVQAKEGFEDSEDEGRKALAAFKATSKDIVILISASGSAKFNIGFGIEGINNKAQVYYFHNSKKVPPRTQKLFDNFGVKKLLVDTGPQAISGSTRLQAATVAELCLGATLGDVIHLSQGVQKSPNYLSQLEKSNQLIMSQLKNISQIIDAGVQVFSHPHANFRKTKDDNQQAYVTVLGDGNSIREILVDTTETAPTFSTNPPRSTLESFKKKAEFRAYLVNESDNLTAWKRLSGFREFSPLDKKGVLEICVADGAKGFGCYKDRPTQAGNLVILVLKSKPTSSHLSRLSQIKKEGGKTALIYLAPESDQLAKSSADTADTIVYIPDVANDPLGIIRTVALKQTLNMISNGMMLGMHKVIGNRMIDLRLANQKLIYRSIRIIKDLFKKSNIDPAKYTDEELYEMLLKANDYKKLQEADSGTYVPSPVKVVLTQLATKVPMQKAIQTLYDNGENIEGLLLGK